MQAKFYVYVHRRATDGSVFYVGKGCSDRFIKRDNRNRHWRSIVAKHDFTAHKIAENMTEPCALAYERALIASIGLDRLCNMTAGGEGISGYRFSDKQRENMGRISSAQWTEEKREAARLRMIGNKRSMTGPLSDELRAKISQSLKGRKMPEGFGAKISAARKGWKMPEHQRKTMSEARKGIPVKEETKRKISESTKGEKCHWYGKSFTDEHRANMSKGKIGIGKKPVIRSDGVTFPSAKDAAAFMRDNGCPKAHPTSITATCKGKQGTSHGFGWSYV